MKGAEKARKRLAGDKLDDVGEVGAHRAGGDGGEEIINYVKKQGIDMIIIGTHGRKGLEKVMFGSVAEGVIKEAPCPVLTINPHTITT
jgi:nucleotide-binding universal stress UspA family protein